MFGSFNFNEVIICCERNKHWITKQRWCNIFVFFLWGSWESTQLKHFNSLEWETCLVSKEPKKTLVWKVQSQRLVNYRAHLLVTLYNVDLKYSGENIKCDIWKSCVICVIFLCFLFSTVCFPNLQSFGTFPFYIYILIFEEINCRIFFQSSQKL